MKTSDNNIDGENRSSTPTFVDTGFSGCQATTDDHKREFFVRAVLLQHEVGKIEDDDLEIHISHNKDETTHKFVLFSKLAPPIPIKRGSKPSQPFIEGGHDSIKPKATKWFGGGGLNADFVSAVIHHSETGPGRKDAGPYNILGNSENFNLLFPSNDSLPVPARTPPEGVGQPSGYVFRSQNAHHVTYRSGNGSIHDLYWTANGWFHQTPSLDAEGTSMDEPEAAATDPYGYSLDDRGLICLAYAGANKVHELVWSQSDTSLGDEVAMRAGWRVETLYTATSEADRPHGRSLGGLFLPERGVVFRTKDGRLRAAVESSSTGGWDIRDLNGGLPAAASDPTGFLMTKTMLRASEVVTRHIFYTGTDGHIYELRSDSSAKTWTATNVTQGLAGIVMPAPDSKLSAYPFLTQNTLHVVYRGTDAHIHELWGFPGSWNYNAAGVGFTKAMGDPVGYVTEHLFVQHIVYRGEGNEVVELWWNGVWREHILTKTVATAPKPFSDVSGYSFESAGSQHVVYFGESGRPLELRADPAIWHPGTYELSNPFPDPLGSLAAPFFYESTEKDHTFFVEPYVVETAVHEWTEWVVATKEYVPGYSELPPLIPITPHAVFVSPGDLGVIKTNPLRFKEQLLDGATRIRTQKGTIDLADTVKAKIGVRKSSMDSPVVDVARGFASRDARAGQHFRRFR